MLKKFFVIFIIILNVTSLSFGATILIDPGHGGEDKGAVAQFKNQSFYEKDLALELSKNIYKKLKQKNFDVYLTRSIDRTVTLEERAELAEKIKADLFISIHMNSSRANKANGFETYYLDNHNDKAVQKVESVENINLQGEALVVNQILVDLVIQQTAPRSRRLAQSIHVRLGQHLKKEFGMVNRGVKAALFYVLALSKRPSVLLEVGFLSNEKELKRLNSDEFQDAYSSAVAAGIETYLKKVK